MTRNDAIQLLRRHAASSEEFKSIIRNEPFWEPHDWAVDALMEATNGATSGAFKRGLMISGDLPVRNARLGFGADATMPVGGHHGKIPGLHVTELQPGTGWPGITKDDFPATVPAAWDGVEDAQLAAARVKRDAAILDGEGSGLSD